MKTSTFCALLAVTSTAWADLRTARELLPAEPAKAAEHMQALLAAAPDDPWLRYDAGVAAYAAKDYAKADETWQQLATSALPDRLRDQVWFQIGNVSYRLAQPQIDAKPDAAVPRLEQSREAFRAALAFNKRNQNAAQNLKLVEQELEKIYARLARQLADAAKKESGNLDKAIEQLQAALTYAQQAQALNPQSVDRERERKEIAQALADALDRKASSHEKTADQRNQNNEGERKNAQEELQQALERFQQAQTISPEDQIAKDGAQRVQQKLAESFDKSARQEQRQGQAAAKSDPQRAATNFEAALDDFQQALAHVPEHADAQAGEKEVRQQLEQLHLEQGDRMAQRGEQQKERQPQEAAENLLGALEHFEQARALDPQNAEIPPRIENVQKQLPAVLTQLAQREQRQAEAAEQRNALGEAVSHLEKAELEFGKTQQIAPENHDAKTGQQEVQSALDRLRQQMAQRANQPQPGQPPPSKEEAQASFESMLARVKKDEEQRDPQARHHTGQRYEEERNRTLRDW